MRIYFGCHLVDAVDDDDEEESRGKSGICLLVSTPRNGLH